IGERDDRQRDEAAVPRGERILPDGGAVRPQSLVSLHRLRCPRANMDPKSIILFSDGTGNSSAKLFKTNVWRLYEAVDLGPPAEGKRAQISYYDDGVGTSSFKPLTVLGGAFGVGLRRNVMDLYRYACRNYRDGDDIYAFGFSRGAFTIRLVVA